MTLGFTKRLAQQIRLISFRTVIRSFSLIRFKKAGAPAEASLAAGSLIASGQEAPFPVAMIQ